VTPKQRLDAAERLKSQIKDRIGVSVEVDVVEPNTVTRSAERLSASLTIATKAKFEQLGQVPATTAGQLFELDSAGKAIGQYDRVRMLTRRREQCGFGDGDTEVKVTAFGAEVTGHAAAARHDV